MSTERAPFPGEDAQPTWRDRAARAARAAESLLATRLEIFREEAAVKAREAGKGLLGVAVAAALGVGVLLLFAALLAAVFARLFDSMVLGILATTLLYAAGAGVAGRVGWQALSRVRPSEFPATAEELERDWNAVSAILSDPPGPSEEDGEPEGGDEEVDEREIEELERRLRGEPQ